jgi:hypothetical protein
VKRRWSGKSKRTVTCISIARFTACAINRVASVIATGPSTVALYPRRGYYAASVRGSQDELRSVGSATVTVSSDETVYLIIRVPGINGKVARVGPVVGLIPGGAGKGIRRYYKQSDAKTQ